MMKWIYAGPLSFALLLVSYPAHGRNEAAWQAVYCKGMSLNVRLPSGGEADCISPEYAIEVEWAYHWAEAVGQALSYATEVNRKPGIIFLCPSSDQRDEGLCRSYMYRLEYALKHVRTHIEVWECFPEDQTLADCFRPVVQDVEDK